MNRGLFEPRCTSAAAIVRDVGSLADCHRRADHFPAMALLALACVGVTVAIVASGIGMTIGPVLDRPRDSSGSFASLGTMVHTTVATSGNSTACNLLNSTYNGTTSLPDYESVSKMFREVCTSPEFIELSQTWAESFAISYGTQHGYGTVFYSFIWLATCSNSTYGTASSCTYQEDLGRESHHQQCHGSLHSGGTYSLQRGRRPGERGGDSKRPFLLYRLLVGSRRGRSCRDSGRNCSFRSPTRTSSRRGTGRFGHSG